MLCGCSCVMVDVCDCIWCIVCYEDMVFLQGVSGMGKELVVCVIYVFSGCEGFFVVVNCGVSYSDLLGSYLFGYEWGSFIGVVCDYCGYFEQVIDGMLFFDEIIEMLLELQLYLLCVLESCVVMLIGVSCVCDVVVWVVVVCNVDFMVVMEQGKLWLDLYYCLVQFFICMFVLVECLEDIVFLVEEFFDVFNWCYGQVKYFLFGVFEVLQWCFWLGNVCELKYVV